MGLDMYLYRETYVQNWSYMKPEQLHKITVLRGGKARTDIDVSKVSHITEQVAYWRKANAIHKWFVDNCQGGVDECQRSYVSVEKLRELVALCKSTLESLETVPGAVRTSTSFHPDGSVVEHTRPGQVVAQPGLAAQMLPTQGGFFFGSTDYDEGYIADLNSTIEMLEPYTRDDEEGDFYYLSSW